MLQCPFREDFQLNISLSGLSLSQKAATEATLPGSPRIRLDQIEEAVEYIHDDLFCAKLDRMAEHLWVMSTHSHKNITPLHRQTLRGRNVVIMEDPGLHLVWIHDRIFIKPLLKYLLSYDFWNTFLLDRAASPSGKDVIVSSALGLLRTYFYLVKYESDFRIAQREDLLPKPVSWIEWCNFSSTFNTISDDLVSKRYEYGELRLTRLNAWSVPLLRTMGFRYVGLQYSDYFAPYFAPLAFVFGVFAILLNAMQVGLAVESLDSQDWRQFWVVCRWFAVVSMFVTVIPAVALFLLLCHRIADEWVYALRQRFRRRRQIGQGKGV